MWRAPTIVFGLLLTGACDETPSPPPAIPTASASANADANAVTLTVKFDEEEKEVAVTTTPLSLASVLPEAMKDQKTWKGLMAKSIDDKRTMGVRRFAEKYPDHDVRLYVDDKGRPSVGIFRKLHEDMPAHIKAKLKKPHVVLVDAKYVHVHTKEIEQKKSTPEVTVAFDGAEKKLTKDALAKLERHAPPGEKEGGKRKKRGWRLQDVLGLYTEVGTVSHVKFVTDEQDSLMIKGSALDAGEITVLLRFNNRGGLGVASYEGDKPPRRMRNVTKIIIASN